MTSKDGRMSEKLDTGRIGYEFARLAPDLDMYVARPERPIAVDLECLGRMLVEIYGLDTLIDNSVLLVSRGALGAAAHVHRDETIFLLGEVAQDCRKTCDAILDLVGHCAKVCSSEEDEDISRDFSGG